MQLHQVSTGFGKKSGKRVGRGDASGRGKTAGRGTKGQGSRQGTRKFSRGFSGGNFPLFKSAPRLRGFRNPNRVERRAISLTRLEKEFTAEEIIDSPALHKKGILRRNEEGKILASGKIAKKLKIRGIPVSAAARAAIEKAGGAVEIPEQLTESKEPKEN